MTWLHDGWTPSTAAVDIKKKSLKVSKKIKMRDHVFVNCCLRSGTHPPPSPQAPYEIAHVLSAVNQGSFEDDNVIFQEEKLKTTQSVEES